MRIYLAGRYSRRLELCGYREELRQMGHVVNAVWLDGEHQIDDKGVPIGEHGEKIVEMTDAAREAFYQNSEKRAAALRQKFAQDDFRDVCSAEMTILFTETPRSSPSRGGRMVEFGIALGRMQRCWIVGPRENIFCWLDDVRQFENWKEAADELKDLDL